MPQFFFTADEEAECLLSASENAVMDVCGKEKPEAVVSAKQLLEENVCDVCCSENESAGNAEEGANSHAEERTEETKSATPSEGTALENVFRGSEPQMHVEKEEEKEKEKPQTSGRWMENGESASCLCCGKRFGVFRRRHVSEE